MSRVPRVRALPSGSPPGSVERAKKKDDLSPYPIWGGRRALVVDDHEQAREVEEDMLRAMSIVAKSVSTGSRALLEITQAEVERAHYDVLLLDWKMPKMDGVAVAEKIRQLSLEQPPLILMITAYDRDEVLRASAHIGISEVLSKPVTSSALFGALSRLMGNAVEVDKGPLPATDKPTSETRHILGATALLVEDNELNQEVATKILKKLGLSVDVAANGAIAIEMARKRDYDLKFMDLQMPVMDGIIALMELRKDPKFKELPVLTMTASAMSADRERCIAAGMNDHIAKPIEPESLENMLHKWLPDHVVSMANSVSDVKDACEMRNEPVTPEAIAGLDTKAGLRRVLGKKALYATLFRKFVGGQKGVPDQIAHEIKVGKLDVAERDAHTLKAVAGNIRALGVQLASMKLEQAIKERRPNDEVHQSLLELKKQLDPLIERLEPKLSNVSPASSTLINPQRVETVCEHLATLLAEDDAEALDVFRDNSEFLQACFPEQYNALESRIQSFDFEDAIRVIAEARKHRQLG